MIAFLFPGQGSQKPGMGKDLYNESVPAREALDRAAGLLGDAFLDTLFAGTDDQLRDTRMAQPALVTVGVAIARHLADRGVTPGCVAGHSVGEIGALVVAETVTFDSALAFTRERARLMTEEAPPGSMAAVIGLAPETIEAHLPDGAEVANFNGPQQTIISGEVAALDTAKDALKAAGAKRVLPLPVSGAFHSSLMKPAAEKLKAFLSDIELRPPATRFVSSVTGKDESDPDVIRDLLWQQLYSPVRWTDVMHTVGPLKALEIGPGNVLQGLARRTDGAPEIAPAGTLDQIEATASLAAKDL